MIGEKTMTVRTSDPVDVAATQTTAPRRRATGRTWGLLLLVVSALTAARVPQVSDDVAARLARGDSGVDLDGLEQAELAVTIGTVTALVLALALQVLVVAGAIAVERRTAAAGRLVVAGRPLSLTFLVVGGVLVLAQGTALLLPAAGGRVEVLVPLALVVATAATALARDGARWGLPARAAIAVGTALMLTFVL
ncbi:hypothetical protein EBM89_02590 [Cellulomonas triticagri]|uniref:Uncharacterized protein n=2 Tax=Cellulomonas triticagri TaxID=2483352 RepID=A0A3M2JIJ9_9CELL|nr:hypothetical protein EBM89_02590 [Cellulomonas triticagri]